MPKNAAHRARLFKSSCDSKFDTLIDVKLQNWYGFKLISQQGFDPNSTLLVKYIPGSPEPEYLITSHLVSNKSLVINGRAMTIELLERALSG